MEKNITYSECKEYRNDLYISLEDIVNNCENALTTEIRQSEIRTKAYIDRKTNETNKKIETLDQKFETLDQNIKEIKSILVQMVKGKNA